MHIQGKLRYSAEADMERKSMRGFIFYQLFRVVIEEESRKVSISVFYIYKRGGCASGEVKNSFIPVLLASLACVGMNHPEHP